MSPVNYLIQRRVGEAQLLIVSTDKPFSQISKMVGYNNVDHFTNLFYKCTGMPPRTFRESYAMKTNNTESIDYDIK